MMSKRLLKSITQSIDLIKQGSETEALNLLRETEGEMRTIIEIARAEDKNAFFDISPL